MPNFRHFLSRRWCRVVGISAVLFALALLHPFVRQSIFGPTIDGIPWCVWEDEIRRSVQPAGQRSWFAKLLEKIGFRPEERVPLDLNSPALAPLFERLADDSDVKVRQLSLARLRIRAGEPDAAVLAVFQRHLQDEDADCRLISAYIVWSASKDADAKNAVLELRNHANMIIRERLAWQLGKMAADAPELLAPLTELASDPWWGVRCAALEGLANCGSAGLPAIRKAQSDSHVQVRAAAIRSLCLAAVKMKEPLPEVLKMRKDADARIRRDAEHTLYLIDPKRFAIPATWVD